MSVIVQKIKDTVSQEGRMRRQAEESIDIANKLIIDARKRQINIQKCRKHQKDLMDRLSKTMENALKIGNKTLYVQTAKTFEVVAKWYDVTTKMEQDQIIIQEFIGMSKTFYSAFLDYKDIVKDFSKATKSLVNFKRFGKSLPKEFKKISTDAALDFSEITDALTNIDMNYIGLTEIGVPGNDEDLTEQFNQERRDLLKRTGLFPEKKGD